MKREGHEAETRRYVCTEGGCLVWHHSSDAARPSKKPQDSAVAIIYAMPYTIIPRFLVFHPHIKSNPTVNWTHRRRVRCLFVLFFYLTSRQTTGD